MLYVYYMYMSVICCYMLYVCDMLYVCYIFLVLGGVVRVRLYVIYAHLCNHMLLRSGGDLRWEKLNNLTVRQGKFVSR